MQLLDPRLGDKYDKDQVEKIIMVASLCIRRSPRMRPRMSLVSFLIQVLIVSTCRDPVRMV